MQATFAPLKNKILQKTKGTKCYGVARTVQTSGICDTFCSGSKNEPVQSKRIQNLSTSHTNVSSLFIYSYKLKHPQRAFFSILTNGDKEYVIDAKTTPGVSMKKGAEQQHGFCEVKMVKKKKSGRFANGHVTKCATY